MPGISGVVDYGPPGEGQRGFSTWKMGPVPQWDQCARRSVTRRGWVPKHSAPLRQTGTARCAPAGNPLGHGTFQRQKPETLRRPLLTTLPFSDGVGVALLIMAALISAAEAPGCVDAYSAAAPLTCGVAMEVPL
jgi:hypothetical protein